MILHPLAQVAIFAFVLSAILSARLPGITNQYAYSIYLMSGILAWSSFSEIISRCLTVFINNGTLFKKLVFPKITLPLIIAGGALINNLLLFVAIVVIFSLLGHYPGASLIWMPIVILLNCALALGLGLSLGVLNVFIRDVGQIVPVLLQLFFWLTPIVYMRDIVPIRYRDWFDLNPMSDVVGAYQAILVYRRAPDWITLTDVAIVGVVVLGVSLFLFRRANAEMVDVL